ncbi:alpha-amylase family glycosyl hydrolase [Croceitalea sp. P059]|uniref:alpha-amylase family glycosyl hydrolase n=1 Tax=Croceitalea sp. P059 TaxID=3075601 RepID=UPI002886F732|nr:alpha-amylase family glycosyl hydrolase [Croceitalea sp. P059]MDT0538307.1 alpha-amylase family glycosyl hydrolase [Croceitalea sp. P059]
MKRLLTLTIIVVALIHSCKRENIKKIEPEVMQKRKVVVYQVFTRLFGNTNTTNKPWGTLRENGVGKFDDFDDKALQEIKDLGITHMWYTGVPHHAVINDYSSIGVSHDDPDVVKGRAGSPYAVKDYYNVNPDLALNPINRLEEFKALIDRTHQHGMKVIIDIVPNHVARNYEGLTNPKGVKDFGADDNTNVEYSRDNNFYYIPNSEFEVPEWQDGYLPLGGAKNNLVDSKFKEAPAKWTGNGSRSVRPHTNDWYETVKINYGVRPDGSYDFETLPSQYAQEDFKSHFEFWKNKDLPDSWYKFRDITLYWLDFGVDGFRFDMAEMVPVEFWSFLNSSIKMKNQDAFILAEVYNPKLYRDYIYKGKMDYLYDKVELYDSIKHIMKGYGWTDHIPVVQNGLKDIEHHMLHFLENHDEQRIASPDFVGKAEIAMPAMVVSATISSSPTMIYFGQEVGEDGSENAGFGSPTRTSIFDYVGVPAHQRWVNNKKYDGGQLTDSEKELRDFYKRLLNFTINSSALMEAYQEVHFYNKENTEGYNHRVLSFVRWSEDEKLIVVSNFDEIESFDFELKLPKDIVAKWNLKNQQYKIKDELYGNFETVEVDNGIGKIQVSLKPLQSYIFRVIE